MTKCTHKKYTSCNIVNGDDALQWVCLDCGEYIAKPKRETMMEIVSLFFLGLVFVALGLLLFLL